MELTSTTTSRVIATLLLLKSPLEPLPTVATASRIISKIPSFESSSRRTHHLRVAEAHVGTDTRWTHTPEKNIARRPPERGCAPAASGRGSATGRATLFQTQTPCDHHRGNTSGKPRQCRPTGFSWKRPPNPRHPQPTCYHTADSQQEPANSQEPAISQNKTHTRTCILQHTQDTYEQITIHIQQAHATQTKH